jgi:hypothetical protein
MKVLKKTTAIITFSLLGIYSCEDNKSQTDTQRIKELEAEVTQLKEQNEKNDSKEHYYTTPPVEIKRVTPIVVENHKYVFGKFKISYYAMSGINEDSKYEDIGITNVLEVRDYSDEKRYKLKDEIKRQHILLSAPFAKHQKIIEIKIFEFDTYSMASKEREEITYDYEVQLTPQ